MVNKKINEEFLKAFLKCSVCNSLIPYDTELCEYCGSITSYDDKFGQYFISGRVCFNCGLENKTDSKYCENCKKKFTFICPKCRSELEVGEEFCKNCGFRIDEFYIENEINRRLNFLIKEKSKKKGLYVAAVLLLFAAILFTVLGFKNEDAYKFGLLFAAVILYALFTVVSKNLSVVKRK